MPAYRCPKHDIVFDSTTDHRMPGSAEKGNFPAHPADGHPDCPRCQEEAKQPTASSTAAPRAAGTVRRIA